MTIAQPLSASLEDYLETIYELVRDQRVARVRDIAQARGVRAASVTPAMRRLVDLGLIRYEKREYIDLTPAGQREARRVFSRHQILKRFLEQILLMPNPRAEADACAMEHSLSPEGMDHLVRFVEFLDSSPDGRRLLGLFRRSGRGLGERSRRAAVPRAGRSPTEVSPLSIATLAAGTKVRVVRVVGAGALRDRLLDMGLLPNVVLEIARPTDRAGSIELRVQGFGLRLNRAEARAVHVTAAGNPS